MKENTKIIIACVITLILGTIINVTATTILQANQVSYKTSNGEMADVNSALDRLFDAADINGRLGNTDISNIGDGTITGAINNTNSYLDELNSRIGGNVYNDTIGIYKQIAATSKHISKDTRYIFPSDGYLNVFDSDSAPLTVYLTDANGKVLTVVTSGRVAGYNVNGTVFVKKGMGCYIIPAMSKVSNPTYYNGFNFYPIK